MDSRSLSLYRRVFDGELLRFPCSTESLKLVEQAVLIIEEEFGPQPELLQGERFVSSLRQARERVGAIPFPELVSDLLRTTGFVEDDLRVDQLRLRAVSPGLEKIEAAAPVFHCHRDTWYGNPSCQINAWLPLRAVNEQNSFRFYLDYFHKPIVNDSERFSATRFASEGGFGRVTDEVASVYPRAIHTPVGKTEDIRSSAGELLVFSASHLHQTSINRTDRVRFSLDFRFFRQNHLAQGIGAPDPDNQSHGLVLDSYRPL